MPDLSYIPLSTGERIPLAGTLVFRDGFLDLEDNDGGVTTVTSGDMADFEEAVEDVVGGLLADSSSIDVTYDDASNIDSLEVNTEWMEDFLNTFVVAGAGITVTYSDVANTLIFAAVATTAYTNVDNAFTIQQTIGPAAGAALLRLMANDGVVGGTSSSAEIRFYDSSLTRFGRFLGSVNGVASGRYFGFAAETDRDGNKLPMAFFVLNAAGASVRSLSLASGADAGNVAIGALPTTWNGGGPGVLYLHNVTTEPSAALGSGVTLASFGAVLRVYGAMTMDGDFNINRTGANAQVLITRVAGAGIGLQSQAALTHIYSVGSFPMSLGTNSTQRWQLTSSGHLIPFADATYTLGDATHRPTDLFLSRNALIPGISHIGSQTAATGLVVGDQTTTMTSLGSNVGLDVYADFNSVAGAINFSNRSTLSGAGLAIQYILTPTGGTQVRGGSLQIFKSGAWTTGTATSINAWFRLRLRRDDVDTIALTVGSKGNVGVGTEDFGSGFGSLAMANAATVPTVNPVGGALMYVEAGVWKIRDAVSGAIGAIGAEGRANVWTGVQQFTATMTGYAARGVRVGKFGSGAGFRFDDGLATDTWTVYGNTSTLFFEHDAGAALITYDAATLMFNVEGGVLTSAYYDSAGHQLLSNRRTGWAAATGTADRATFATYAAPVISAAYVQAEVQAIANAVQVNARHMKALVDDLLAHGVIGA